MAGEEVVLGLGVDVSDFNSGIAAAQTKLNSFDGTVDKAAKSSGGFFGAIKGGVGGIASMVSPLGLATAGIGALTGGLGAAVAAASEEAVGIERLNQTLQNAIPGWSDTTGAIDSYIEKQERLSFADDALRDSLGFLVGQTKNLGEAQALQATAMDLARAKGISLEAATKAVGKVDQESIGILKKLGIEVTEEMTKEEALTAIRAASAGQAEAYAATAAGSMERIQNELGNVVEDIGGLLLPVLTGGLQAILGLADALGSVLGPAFTVIGGLIQQVVGFFQSLMPPMTDTGTAVTGLGETFNRVWGAIQAFIQPVIDAIVTKLSVFWTEIQPQLNAAMENIRHIVVDVVWPIVQSTIVAGVTMLVGFWTSNWGTIKSVLEGVWNAIKGVVQVVWSVISGLIKTGLAVLSGDWSGAWTHIKEMVSGVWEGIQGIVSGAWQAITGLLTLGLQALQGIWDTAWNAISTAASTIWTNISTAVSTKFGEIATFLTNFPGTILGAVVDIGRSIIDGIVQGLRNAGQAVIDFLVGLIGDAVDAVKNFLGISSPSRVFAAVGLQMSLGLVEGMKASIPIIDNARNLMLGAATPGGLPTIGGGGFGTLPVVSPGGGFGIGAGSGGGTTNIFLEGVLIGSVIDGRLASHRALTTHQPAAIRVGAG